MTALWTSDEIARALSPVAMPEAFETNGVTFDSRAVAPGDLFFALSGETTDGHAFVADALGRGAAAAIVSRDVPEARGKLVKVRDTTQALVDLGRAGRQRSNARIASVTGSVGKTSTKDALRAMLSAQAPTAASAASFNNHVGVPISLARLPRDARYGVFEIGMNHPGEIEPLARLVEAHVGVITNIEPAHIGHMGSEEAIADEKACLFAGMRQGAVAVLNRDNRHFDRLTASARRFGVARIVGFGRHEAAEARLLACRLHDSGSDVVALIHGQKIEYRLGAAGEHWVLNSLAALAVVEALGGDVARGAASLAEVKPSPGRGARRHLVFGSGSIELIDESYNANPASVRAMLAVFARTQPASQGRRLLVLGDMRELGQGADDYHGGLADAVAASGADQVFLCGPHMKALWQRLAQAQRGAYQPDSVALAPLVASGLRAGDVVAVKGSLGSKMKTVVDAILAASGGDVGR
ncbi:UDP-N-acetylmuramoyl-tripeptide--D-alanyl-D-alanine ligase [Enhydrobacter aerosaccus]|uniref:UDP-N-acetylmuramoyl-tripeptide--D-alanyl-D-alanine ligase n=1 Tax=Enhydrobacter aerosaccus TaxID=225324 RepID=A0A1T4JPR6_9HYPH|nr:UDP-N-acetylmuramoylalanyl-D-glutamyl-2,6-diaminopimelate--D-alanyl-D-alanine ligase [Enhydrobacter aerosaccus]SJZ32055.1 UDP-N-acetylmuramoyl-tripeptide--D-alanyl-D-alanine ligase [Enhydrobacter aerosaccus]